MPYSYATYTGNGSTTQFAVPFGYVRREHVLATVATVSATFTWVNDSLIQMTTAPANGAAVRVYRLTPLTAPLVDFADGATLVAADLDTNAKQSIYTQQELDDALVDVALGAIPNGNKGDITTSVGGTVWTVNAGLSATKSTFTQAGSGAVARTVDSKLKDVVSVKDFGAVGNGVANDTAAIQAAVDAVCNAEKTLYFPAGTYKVSAPITFPNKSFCLEGDGPTSTNIQAFNPAASTTLFSFSGSGPAKVIRNLGFLGPAAGNYGVGAGIAINGNGFYLESVWFRGLVIGLDAAGSLINCNQCVAEYCYEGAKVQSSMPESIWYGWTMYKNETDFNIAGTQTSFVIRDFNAIGTKTDVVLCSASGLMIDGALIQNDGTAYTPNVFNILGAYNQINNVKIANFGLRGILFQGAGATKNRISNVVIEGVPTGILASAASNNFVSNLVIKGSTTYAIRVESGSQNTFTDFLIENSAYGISMFAAELTAAINGRITGSTTADWHLPTANISYVLTHNVEANFSGISAIPYQVSRLPSGNFQAMVTAAPTTASWSQGDVAINRQPAVGSPKGWRCTVAGTPGTWVSEGNL